MSALTNERVLWARFSTTCTDGKFPLTGEPVFTTEAFRDRGLPGGWGWRVFDAIGRVRDSGEAVSLRAAQDAAQRWCRENTA